MERLKTLLAEEPVRVYVYGLVAAVLGALVLTGVIGQEDVLIWLGVVAAALALPSPVESARARVSPVPQQEDSASGSSSPWDESLS